MTNSVIFPLRDEDLGMVAISDGVFPFPIIELGDEELAQAAGGRRCGAGSGGKVGEVPVVTG
jgi:hypothetical protein